MSLTIPIIDTILDTGKTVINKIWMDAGDKAKIELTKEELQQKFDLALKTLAQNGELTTLEMLFEEYQAQRDFANDQFGKAEVLKGFGWAGKFILIGRASIRWVITGGSMFFTWKLMNTLLTSDVMTALAGGTLATGAVWLITLMVCLIIGIPLFYVSGISIEKIMGVRNKL